ncbi:hypothetical protein ETU09_02810 [Apibacter muscae]|uniref:Uncharacterized protein n=1 Tax=Apibacter muscae TaxID=2509004 RepID=A0A563DIK8_9FLAO|nr:hypothetical protein [Apibacter muscae]TWP29929.1 hypothetical protein ETU09_02810 [Apibacter muscae]
MNYFIKETFNEQYTLLIDSDMQGVDVHMTSRSQMRWDFTILKVEKEYAEVRIILLDHALLESNNSMVKEVAQVSQIFSRMYNELHINLNFEGKVTQIHNIDIIQEKWNQTKKEMEGFLEHSPEIKPVIQLNDAIFSTPEKIKQAIQANELISNWWGILVGKEIPSTQKDLTQPNFFNTAQVQWTRSFREYERDKIPGLLQVEVLTQPTFMLSDGFYNRAYSQFADKIDISTVNTLLREEGKFQIEETSGRLIQAIIKRKEEAAPNLYTRLTYTLLSDEIYKQKLKEQPQAYRHPENKKENAINNPEEKNETTPYKIYRGKKYSQEEWEDFEAKQFKIYAEKNNIRMDPKEEKPKKKAVPGKFFIDEKESDY